jgi:hypothetical protein
MAPSHYAWTLDVCSARIWRVAKEKKRMTQNKVLVLHGPNLNLLGSRQPEIYGSETLEDINNALYEKAALRGWDIACRQSNHEGEIVDFLHQNYKIYDLEVIYQHYRVLQLLFLFWLLNHFYPEHNL